MSVSLRSNAKRDSSDAVCVKTLPAWTYNSDEFFALEKRDLILNNWQLLCHVNDVKRAGDFATLTVVGERALVVRGKDGILRAFHNVCRHRAAAVARGPHGRCDGNLRCFYHGWTYGLDGRLKAVPGAPDFPKRHKGQFDLRPLDIEIYLGLVFIRFRGTGASVAERFAPYTEELSPYRLPEMERWATAWNVETGVDWKNVVDNNLEGYHVPVGHPGLFRLFGSRYEIETRPGGVSRAIHWLRDKHSQRWSERHYQILLPAVAHLPPDRRRAWAYYAFLPNLAYPDQMDFYQVLPTAAGRSTLVGHSYRLPTPDRRLRAAQYLNRRINDAVGREDMALIRSVQEGLGSESYDSGVLMEKELCVRQFHDMVRAAIPIATQEAPPTAGMAATINEALRAR